MSDIYFKARLDNSQLTADAQVAKTTLAGVGDSAVAEGARVDNAVKTVTESIDKQIQNLASKGQTNAANIESMVTGTMNRINTKISKMGFADTVQAGIDSTKKKIELLKEEVSAMHFDLKNPNSFQGTGAADTSMAVKQLMTTIQGLEGELTQLQSTHDKTTSKVVRMRTEMMNLREQMSRMGEAGQRNTAEYEQVRSALVKLTKQYNLTRKEAQILANPNARTQAVISGINGISGALTAATGVVGMFTDDNEKLIKIQTKLQSVMAITMGIQQMTATFTQASAFKIVIMSKAQNLCAVSSAFLGRAFTVMGFSAAAAATMGKVALAGLTLGLSLLIGWIAEAIAKWQSANQSMQDATKQASRQITEAVDGQTQTVAQSISALEKLQRQWNALGNSLKAKQKFITDNKEEFHKLGFSVNSVSDAENILVKNTAAVVKALELRAKAAAYQSIAEDEYKKMAQADITAEMQLKQKPLKEDYKKNIQTKVWTSSSTFYMDTQTGYDYNDEANAKKNQAARIKHQKDLARMHSIYGNQITKMQADSEQELASLQMASGLTPYVEQKKEKKKKDKKDNRTEEEYLQILNENNQEAIRYKQDLQNEMTQAEINSLADGTSKVLAQMELDHTIKMQKLDEQEQDALKKAQDRAEKAFKANPDNPKDAVFDRSTITLSTDQTKLYNQLRLNEEKAYNKSIVEEQQKVFKTLIEKYKSYADARKEAEDKFNKERVVLVKNGATKDSLDLQEKDKNDTLSKIDETFAESSETYKQWMDTITNMTVQQLLSSLIKAQLMLQQQRDPETGATKNTKEVAVLRATIAKLQDQLNKTSNGKTGNTTKNSVKEWKDLNEVLSKTANEFKEIGKTIGGVAGDVISFAGEIAATGVAMISSIGQLAAGTMTSVTAAGVTTTRTLITVEKASVILAIISAAMQIAQMIASLLKDGKSQEQDQIEIQGALASTLNDYNNKLIATKLLQDEVWGTNALKNMLNAIEALSEAQSNYNNLLNGTAFNSTQTLRESLQYKTRSSGTWHHSRWQNLEDWVKQNMGQDLFDSEGSINIDLAESLLSKNADRLDDTTKDNLQALIDAQKSIEDANDAMTSYISETFGDLGDGMADAIVNAFKNGENAAEAFGDSVQEIIQNIGLQMVKTLLMDRYFNAYQSKLTAAYKQFDTDKDQGKLDAAIVQYTSDLMDSLPEAQTLSDELLQTLSDAYKKAFGEDLYTSDSREASSGDGIASASQDSIDELNGRMSAIQEHTYNIVAGMQILISTSASILEKVIGIKEDTARLVNIEITSDELRNEVAKVREVMDSFNIHGITIKR
ncbi:hypothetical protein [uncultured Bacteroides sp.]|uniref:hypothetical protein n=1 Tax=uncultured Bacteroides sp. TaxID=162156 RepID=UPI002AAB9780|nr:hypothetical protein [uncultured Bacteroides sp.]